MMSTKHADYSSCPLQIAVFDYGAGNVHSAVGALRQVGANALLTADPTQIRQADALVVPGVGAFQMVMERLHQAGGVELILEHIQNNKPLLGICVGMQILFDSSTEKGQHAGLGILPGVVSQLPTKRLPHMGWTPVYAAKDSLLFQGIADESFYFVHSYGVLAAQFAKPHPQDTLATHGQEFLAAIERGPIFATQFHPEKSGHAGLALLKNWLSFVKKTIADK